MSILRLAASRFKNQATIFLEKNFNKHKNYLKNTILKTVSNLYNENDFDQALSLFSDDPDKSIDQLYKVVEKALEEKFYQELAKGNRLLKAHNSDNLEIRDNGSGDIKVDSENDPNKTYTVSLIDYTCNCPQGKKLSYAGLFCKHLIAAYELFKDKYPPPVDNHTQKVFRMEKSNENVEVDLDEYFIYGSQKLKKREKRGNPYIPRGIYHVLSGGEPEIVIYALRNDETLLLIGDSGVGKSMLIRYLAQETNTPLLSASAHADMTVENLLGAMTVVNKNTVWRDGVIPSAMKRGYWLLIDEMNSIDPGVLKVLNELLDTGRITITVAGNPKVVKAHDNFRLICTMNPPDNPIYKGIESFSFEFFDRFETVVYLDYLEPETEIQLIIKKTGYTDKNLVEKMVDFANRVRAGMQKGELFATVTTRGLLSWARKIEEFGVRTACEVSVLRKMSSADRNKALDLYSAIFSD